MMPVLLGLLVVLIIYYVRARLEIRNLRWKLNLGKGTTSQISPRAGSDVSTLQNLAGVSRGIPVLMSNKEFDGLGGIVYQDRDGDGVPDVFQRRKPLAEVLEFEKDSVGHQNDYWVAIELPARYPVNGEYFINCGIICKASETTRWTGKFIIVKSVPGTNLDDLVELTR